MQLEFLILLFILPLEWQSHFILTLDSPSISKGNVSICFCCFARTIKRKNAEMQKINIIIRSFINLSPMNHFDAMGDKINFWFLFLLFVSSFNNCFMITALGIIRHFTICLNFCIIDHISSDSFDGYCVCLCVIKQKFKLKRFLIGFWDVCMIPVGCCHG